MVRHWEHTEVLGDKDFRAFADLGCTFKPLRPDLPYNTAVLVSNQTGTRILEGIYDPEIKAIRQLKDKSSPNRDLRLYVDAIRTPGITFLAVDGLMGSGKTSTAVQYVCDEYLKTVRISPIKDSSSKTVEHTVVIAKPYVNAGGSSEQMGFLPGDINDKMDPTLGNFIQYFNRFHPIGFDKLRESGYVEILPLAYIRGLDKQDTTIIADECQNTSELISLATRKGKGSRILFLGDTSPFQIDLRGNTPTKNGLTKLIDLLSGAPYFQYIELKTIDHILRSDEVRDIVRRLFKKHGSSPQEWKT